MKGLIALDIDGTITVDLKPTPTEVVQYLHQLVESGWCIIFITGRTYHWGYEALRSLDFPYFYAVQNGAAILRMPDKEVVSRKYLNRDILPVREKICGEENTDFIVYTGYERSGFCYYRPEKMDQKLLEYLEARTIAFKEHWESVKSFDKMPLNEFPVVKCFGSEEQMNRISDRVSEELQLDAPVIRDPFNESFFLMQATCPGINKGQAIRDLKKMLAFEGSIIAAGDDNNDISMLQEADIKIAMENAPEHLRRMADIVAPGAEEEGIITGLNRAMRLVR